MKTLEAAFETDFSKISFLERKISITSQRTILSGPPRSGKSYLIYDYLSNFKKQEYLYIDLKDPRNSIDEIKNSIDEFIIQNDISTIAVENYNFEFDIPNCNIIVISGENIHMKGFENLKVNALDFEEFLLHDKKHNNILSSFNYFLKYGNLPELIAIEENKKASRVQEIIKLYAQNNTEYEILKLLLRSLGEKKSVYQLFNTMKKSIKISKDKFYAYTEKCKNNNIIFFLQKYDQPRAVNKIFAYNHTFIDVFSHRKNFANEFANMIFLELKEYRDELYYLDGVDFYLPSINKIILSIPFFNPLIIDSLTKKVIPAIDLYDIKSIDIVTVGVEQSFYMQDIEVEVQPFYEWALAEIGI